MGGNWSEIAVTGGGKAKLKASCTAGAAASVRARCGNHRKKSPTLGLKEATSPGPPVPSGPKRCEAINLQGRVMSAQK